MSFEDLEKKLKQWFEHGAATPCEQMKARHQEMVMRHFSSHNRGFFLFSRKWAPAVGALFLGIFGYSFLQETETIAGKIKPLAGPIEIIRGEESFLVQRETDLQVGDIVNVGNRGSAKISMPDQLVSIAENRTKFQITNANEIFLEKGVLKNNAFRGGSEIATDRGFVKSSAGSKFEISVSETGETAVSPEQNWVNVYDLVNGNVILNSGEQVVLRSDTRLAESDIPNDLNLSNAQIDLIRAKLVIARTKILTGVEKILEQKNISGAKDIESAEKTFRSVAQVLLSSRELEIARRKNLSLIDLEEISDRVAQKTQDEVLLKEIQAIETVFTILQQHRGQLAFGYEKTGIESFDRFVLLDRILSLGKAPQKAIGEILLQKYAIIFLRDIQNQELKIDQISLLNEHIEQLPRNHIAQNFLRRVENLFDPVLAEILEEKIQSTF